MARTRQRPQPRTRWWMFGVFVAVLGAYAPALRAPFIFDDELSIEKNESIRTLWPPSTPLTPPGGDLAVSGRPIANYSLALNYAANRWLDVDQRPSPDGPNKTIGYHLVNLALHLLIGALLFGIVRRTIASDAFDAAWRDSATIIAGWTAALWLLHPIQSEAVNYLVQRTELLASSCYAATVYASIRAWDASSKTRRLRWYALAVIACALGMGSKEIAITAPLAVILYDRAFRSRHRWRERLSLYGALAATTVIAATLIASGPRAGTVGFSIGIPWYRYLYSQAWAISQYLWLTVWPRALTLDYGSELVSDWRAIPGLIVLGAFGVVTLLAWARVARWGWFAFLGSWFFLLLAPSSSVVPIATETAAERRIYLALAAVIVLMIVGVEAARRRFGRPVRIASAWSPRTSIALGLVVAALGVTTYRRSDQYMHPSHLWQEVLDRYPRNPRGPNGVAYSLIHEQPPRVAEAIPYLDRAIALDSNFLQALRARAAVALSVGDLRGARPLLQRAFFVDSTYADVRPMLGIVTAAAGDLRAAARYLDRVDVAALADGDPNGARMFALGTTYMMLGRWADAQTALRRTLAINPSFKDARLALGDALIRGGAPREAVATLQRAISIDPSAYAVALLSVAYATSGNPAGAIEAAQAATMTPRATADIFFLAGRAMMTIKATDRAEPYFRSALGLSPRDADIAIGLALAMKANGKGAEARGMLQRVMANSPDLATAQHVLDTAPMDPHR